MVTNDDRLAVKAQVQTHIEKQNGGSATLAAGPRYSVRGPCCDNDVALSGQFPAGWWGGKRNINTN